LRPAKGSVIQKTAILSRERHTLRHTLVNNVETDLGHPIDIRFTRAEVSALYRVLKEPINTVAIIAIVLGSVDTSLGRNAVCSTRTVVITETLNVITQLR